MSAAPINLTVSPARDNESVSPEIGYAQWPARCGPRESIACVWVHRPGKSGADRVLPDACMDVIWDGARLFVAGPDTVPSPIAGRPGTAYAGLRFRPGRAPGFLGTPACELINDRVDLAEFWGRARADRMADQLASAPTAEAAANLLDHLVAQVGAKEAPDPVVGALVGFLARQPPANGTVRAASIALSVNERRLYQHCRAMVGYGPKTLERVIRFQRALRMAGASACLADLAARSGYADQSHLTRECRRLAGTTPSDLFKTAGPASS
jgi:AraC-like DNA-binding protein